MDPISVLKESFAASGLSDRDLAEKSGVHVITVRRYLSGDIKTIGAGNAKKLADALGLDPLELLYGRTVASAS